MHAPARVQLVGRSPAAPDVLLCGVQRLVRLDKLGLQALDLAAQLHGLRVVEELLRDLCRKARVAGAGAFGATPPCCQRGGVLNTCTRLQRVHTTHAPHTSGMVRW
jgi:hypothetical protein